MKEKNTESKEIIGVTFDIDKVRREIKLCDEVDDNAGKVKRYIRYMKKMK